MCVGVWGGGGGGDYFFPIVCWKWMYNNVKLSYPDFTTYMHQLTISSLKQVIFDQTRQNGCQTVPFGVYIHIFHFLACSENSLDTLVILTLIHIGYL